MQRLLQLLMGAGRCRHGCGRFERTQTSPPLVGCVYVCDVVQLLSHPVDARARESYLSELVFRERAASLEKKVRIRYH